MAKKAYGSSSKTDKPDDLVEKVTKGWKASWDYRDSSYHTIWQDMNKLYNSERVYVGYNGISDTFVPMSNSTVETMVAATSGDKPEVVYFPTDPAQSPDTDILNALYAYYWDLDQWTLKSIGHNRNLFKIGSGVGYMYWNIDHPCWRVIPLRDFFCDPAATILNYQEEADYMGFRFLSTVDSLQAEKIVDPETGELVAKYKNLDKLGKYSSGDKTAKEEQDQFMGSTMKDKDNQVEVICYYTLDEVIYVGNRKEVIYYGVNDFKQRQQFLGYENPTGMFPFFVDANQPDETQLYGTSVLQPIAKPQELLNDLTNQNIDAVTWALDPVMELDPMYQDYIPKIQNVPGAVYPFKPGSYQSVQKAPIQSSVFNERTNIKNEIRETTGVDEILKGVQAEQAATATAIKAQAATSGRRFDLLTVQLQSGGYYQQAKLTFQLIQHYVTQPTMLRIIGEAGAEWKKYDPQFFKGDYEPRVKLKSTLDNEKNLKMRDIKEMYSALLGSPFVNQQELTRLTVEKAYSLEPDEAQALVQVDPQEIAQSSQAKGKPPTELINYKDAPPDVQAQMEQAAGFQPSATHEGSMETTASQQLADQAQHGEMIAPTPTTPPQPLVTGQPAGAPNGP